MTPNAFLLEMERFITHAFDNEEDFIKRFFPHLEEGWTLEECHMASGQTKVVLDDFNVVSDGPNRGRETWVVLTLDFISWVNGNVELRGKK